MSETAQVDQTQEIGLRKVIVSRRYPTVQTGAELTETRKEDAFSEPDGHPAPKELPVPALDVNDDDCQDTSLRVRKPWRKP